VINAQETNVLVRSLSGSHTPALFRKMCGIIMTLNIAPVVRIAHNNVRGIFKMVDCNFQYEKKIGVLTGEPQGVYSGDLFDVVQEVSYETWVCCSLKGGYGKCDQGNCIFWRDK